MYKRQIHTNGHCISEIVVAYEPVWAIGTGKTASPEQAQACLLYTSDAADDLLCVDLGGRRIIKKKTQPNTDQERWIAQTDCY